MYRNAYQKHVGKFAEYMPDLIWLPGGTEAKVRQAAILTSQLTETFPVTGKLGVLRTFSFCRTGSVQDARTKAPQHEAE